MEKHHRKQSEITKGDVSFLMYGLLPRLKSGEMELWESGKVAQKSWEGVIAVPLPSTRSGDTCPRRQDLGGRWEE